MDAVAVNVTIVDPTAPTFVALHAAGRPTPRVSNVNAIGGQTVANLAVVAVGDGGRIHVVNDAGAAHVLIDVAGWTSTRGGTAGGRFHAATTPTRLLDTRDGTALGPGELRGLTVRGVGGVPAGAVAVALKVTAVAPSAATYVSVHPSDAPIPMASNLNAPPGTTVAATVFSGIGADGRGGAVQRAGSTHLAVDVLGWWDLDRSDEAGRYIPLELPVRFADTRWHPWASELRQPLGPGERRAFLVAEPALEQWLAPPPLGAATLFNLTVTNPTAATYVVAYPGPDRATPPWASTVNVAAGQTAASTAISAYDATDTINVANAAGCVDVIIDLAGFFTGPGF